MIKTNNASHTLIIAEIGTAHSASFETAQKLVHAAINAGADCIKFQWVYADEILHPNTGFVDLPTGKIRLYDRFKELEVAPSFYYRIQEYVHSLGKTFMCSPFGSRSLEELFAIKPDYIKIASPELNHIPLLRQLVELELVLSPAERIPVVLSTGVSTMEDIKKTLAVLEPLKQQGTNALSLLHCVTSYPAPPEDYNLALLQAYLEEFDIPIGVSDHTLDPCIVPILSIACGGTIIEKHITLSRETDGLDDPVALDPDDFKRMVQEVRRAEKMDMDGIFAQAYDEFGEEITENVIGTGKKVLAPSEKANYGTTNRSIHFMRSMKKGETLGEKDIAVLRTEKVLTPGISPEFWAHAIGKTLVQDVNDGEGLLWEHFGENSAVI